jgi:hypothetical protein
LVVASTHWRIGLALLELNDSKKAADHFSIARDTDRRGKYRNLAKKKLEELKSLL